MIIALMYAHSKERRTKYISDADALLKCYLRPNFFSTLIAVSFEKKSLNKIRMMHQRFCIA